MYLETPQGRRLAYHKTEGTGPCVVFLGGLKSDMMGTKAVFLEGIECATVRTPPHMTFVRSATLQAHENQTALCQFSSQRDPEILPIR